jgi:hypothetical protein
VSPRSQRQRKLLGARGHETPALRKHYACRTATGGGGGIGAVEPYPDSDVATVVGNDGAQPWLLCGEHRGGFLTMPRLRIEDLKAELVARLPFILHQILRNARPDGRNRWKGYTPSGDLVVVDVAGQKKGYVCNTADGPGSGNLFNLVAECLAGGSVSEACRIAHGLIGTSITGPPDARWVARERQRAEDAAQRNKVARERMLRCRATEYHAGTPQRATSPSGLYLIGRGCELSEVLRDHPSRYSGDLGDLPAMIAQMIDPEQLDPRAYHVTYLQRDGDTFRKANLTPAKKTFGSTAGCIIPLLRGRSGLRMHEALHAQLRETVLIGEGIENTLSAHAALPEDLRSFAAGSVGNLPKINLPKRFVGVVLVRDVDGPLNRGAPAARAQAIERWVREGRAVEVFDPPPPYEDMNDAVCAFAVGI